MFVGFVVIEIRLFNRKKKKKQKTKQKKKKKKKKMKNMKLHVLHLFYEPFFQISLAFNMFPTLVLV